MKYHLMKQLSFKSQKENAIKEYTVEDLEK